MKFFLDEQKDARIPPRGVLRGIVRLTNCIETGREDVEFGCRCFQESDDRWSCVVFPGATELCGGPDDGALVLPGIIADIPDLMLCFDILDSCRFISPPPEMRDEQSTYLAIEGRIDDVNLLFCLLSAPPDCIGPRQLLRVVTGVRENLW